MNLWVCSLPEVEAVRFQCQPSHVLSLLAPDAEAPDFDDLPSPQRLLLRFNDINAPRDGYIAPDAGHVDAILAFSRAWRGRRPLLIHCLAGISRSTAAAYIIACDRAGPGRERILARRLRAAAPSATPNPLLTAHADQALGRDGRMIAAIEDIGRGAFARAGAPFRLLSPGPVASPSIG
jgi:predicted protein tyrosine phosphatase